MEVCDIILKEVRSIVTKCNERGEGLFYCKDRVTSFMEDLRVYFYLPHSYSM